MTDTVNFESVCLAPTLFPPHSEKKVDFRTNLSLGGWEEGRGREEEGVGVAGKEVWRSFQKSDWEKRVGWKKRKVGGLKVERAGLWSS